MCHKRHSDCRCSDGGWPEDFELHPKGTGAELERLRAIVARVKDPDTIQRALRCTAPSLRTGERLGMMAFRREALGEEP